MIDPSLLNELENDPDFLELKRVNPKRADQIVRFAARKAAPVVKGGGRSQEIKGFLERNLSPTEGATRKGAQEIFSQEAERAYGTSFTGRTSAFLQGKPQYQEEPEEEGTLSKVFKAAKAGEISKAVGEVSPRLGRATRALGRGELKAAAGEIGGGIMRAPAKAAEGIASGVSGAFQALGDELYYEDPSGNIRFAGFPGTAAGLGAIVGNAPDIAASMLSGGAAGLGIRAAAPRIASSALRGAAGAARGVSPTTSQMLNIAAQRAAQPLGPAGTFAALQAGQAGADYAMPYVQTRLAGGTEEQAREAAMLGTVMGAPLGLLTGYSPLRQAYREAFPGRPPVSPGVLERMNERSMIPSPNLYREFDRGAFVPFRDRPQAQPAQQALTPEQVDLVRRYTMGERLPLPDMEQIARSLSPTPQQMSTALVPYAPPVTSVVPVGQVTPMSGARQRAAFEQQFGELPVDRTIYAPPPPEPMSMVPVGEVTPMSQAVQRAAFERQYGALPVDETIYAGPPAQPAAPIPPERALTPFGPTAIEPVGPVSPMSTAAQMQQMVAQGLPIQMGPGLSTLGARALYGQVGNPPIGKPLPRIQPPMAEPATPPAAQPGGLMRKGAAARTKAAAQPPVAPPPGAQAPLTAASTTRSARPAAAAKTTPVSPAVRQAEIELETALRDRNSAEVILGKNSKQYKNEDAAVKKAQAKLDELKKKDLTPEQPSTLQRLISEESGEFNPQALGNALKSGLTGVSSLIDSAGSLVDAIRGSAITSALRNRAAQVPTMGGRAGGVVSGAGRRALDIARTGAEAAAEAPGVATAGRVAGRVGTVIAQDALPRIGDIIERGSSLPMDVARRPANYVSDQLAEWVADNQDSALRGVVETASNILGRNSYENAEAFKKMLRTPTNTSSALYNDVMNSIRRVAIGQFGMSKSMIDAVQAIEDKAINDLRVLQDYGAELIAKHGDDQDTLIRIGKDLEDPNYSGNDDLILRGKQILKDISKSIYDIGGITEGAFKRYGETGSYLPRIYRKFLIKNENSNGTLMEYFRLANEDPSLSGYEHRGHVERLTRDKLLKEVDEGVKWEVLGQDPKDPNKIIAWRDWTEAEQNKWAREWNPMPAIVKLHEQALRDLRAGRIFEYLRNGQDELGVYAKKVYDLGLDPAKEKPKNFIDENGQNWVYLDPSAKVKNGVSKYGRLSGMYVRDDIASYLKFHNEYGNFRRTIKNLKRYTGQDYFKQMVTLWSTKYYVNNFFNAMPMVELAGGSVTDMPLALKELRANSDVVKQLERENVIRRGALLRDLAKYSEDVLAENLKKDGFIGHAAASNVLGESAKKIAATRRTLQGISEATDDLWRVTLYMGLRRRKNLSHKEAIDIVRDAIYDSKRVTSPLAAAAEIAIPFAKSATWMLDQTAVNSIRNPHKLAYLMGIGAFMPWAMGKMSGATEEKMASEEEIIQDFLKDPKIPGTDKTFAIGFGKKLRLFEDKDGKAYYLDTSNFGGLQGSAADVGDSAFAYLPKALQPGGPYWMLVQLIMNRDQFKDQQIVLRDDMGRDIAVDRKWLYSPVAEFLARQLAPSVVVDSMRLAKSMLGVPEAGGTVVSPATRLAGMAGLKIREVDREMQIPLREFKGKASLGQWQKEINKQYRILERMYDKNVAPSEIEKQEQKIQAFESRLEELTSEEDETLMRIYEGLE